MKNWTPAQNWRLCRVPGGGGGLIWLALHASPPTPVCLVFLSHVLKNREAFKQSCLQQGIHQHFKVHMFISYISSGRIGPLTCLPQPTRSLAARFIWVMENLESHAIYYFSFQAWKDLESRFLSEGPGKSWK